MKATLQLSPKLSFHSFEDETSAPLKNAIEDLILSKFKLKNPIEPISMQEEFPSCILTDKAQKVFVENYFSLGHKKKVNYKLLYTGSKNGLNLATFHEC
jgi:hypothetical protein